MIAGLLVIFGIVGTINYVHDFGVWSATRSEVLLLISMGVYKFATLETTISKLLNLLALLILFLET